MVSQSDVNETVFVRPGGFLDWHTFHLSLFSPEVYQVEDLMLMYVRELYHTSLYLEVLYLKITLQYHVFFFFFLFILG